LEPLSSELAETALRREKYDGKAYKHHNNKSIKNIIQNKFTGAQKFVLFSRMYGCGLRYS
jgi:hypothetical protein